MAPHVIEKADTEGERTGVLLGGVSIGGRISEGHACERWAVSLTGAAETAPMTPSVLPNNPRGSWRVTRPVRQGKETTPWVQIANPGYKVNLGPSCYGRGCSRRWRGFIVESRG